MINYINFKFLSINILFVLIKSIFLYNNIRNWLITKYYIINDTHAGSCSNDIENCVSCESINNCTKCKYTYVFDNEKGKCVEKSKLNTQNSENDNSTESSNDNKGTQGSTKPKTSSKRRVVKKNKENNSSYFSLSSIIMIQAIYAILLLINF